MLARAAQVALRPFDRPRPLWEGVLFEGVPRRRRRGAAYVLKIHHALADPLGIVQLLSMLQSGRRAHTARKPLGDEAADRWPPTGRARAWRASAPTSLRSRSARTSVRTLGHAAVPAAGGRARRRYDASVRRLLDPDRVAVAGAVPTHRQDVDLLNLDAPLEPLRTVARHGGGTLDDAAVALVLGGMRRYHTTRQ